MWMSMIAEVGLYCAAIIGAVSIGALVGHTLGNGEGWLKNWGRYLTLRGK